MAVFKNLLNIILLMLACALIGLLPLEALFKSASGATVTKFIGYALVGIWLFNALLTQTVRPLHAIHWILTALTLWSFASVLWSVNPSITAARALLCLMLLVLSFVTWDLLNSSYRLHLAMLSYMAGAASLGTTSIFQILTGHASVFESQTERATTFGLDPNYIGYLLVTSMPMAIYLLTLKRSMDPTQDHKGLRKVGYLFGLLNLAAVLPAILLTGSRTATAAAVGVGLLSVVLSLFAGRAKRLISSVVFGCVLVAGIVTFVTLFQHIIPEGPLTRVLQMGEQFKAEGFEGRGHLWKSAIDLFLANPFIGVGAAAYRFASNEGLYAHSVYLAMLAELGLIGGVILFALLAILLRAALSHRGQALFVWSALLMVWCLCNATAEWHVEKISWILPAMIASAASSTPTRSRRRSWTGSAGRRRRRRRRRSFIPADPA